MSEQEMISIIEDVLEIEHNSLSMDSVLADYPEWDSLAVISLLSYFDDKLGKRVSPRVVKEFITVADIIKCM